MGADGAEKRAQDADDRARRQWETVAFYATKLCVSCEVGGVELQAVKLKVPQYAYGDWMLVLTALDHEGRPVVAFMSGDTLQACWSKAFNQLERGELRWKVDKYRE